MIKVDGFGGASSSGSAKMVSSGSVDGSGLKLTGARLTRDFLDRRLDGGRLGVERVKVVSMKNSDAGQGTKPASGVHTRDCDVLSDGEIIVLKFDIDPYLSKI